MSDTQELSKHATQIKGSQGANFPGTKTILQEKDMKLSL